MATRRTSSSRSSGGRSRRASSSSSSSNQGLFIGIGVVALIAVAAVFLMGGGGGSSGGSGGGSGSGGSSATGSSAAGSSSSTPAPSRSSSLPSAQATSGKTPDRPAPAITQAALDSAEEHYARSKELWNDGQKARTSGDSDVYTQSLKDAFAQMEMSRDALRDQTDWLDEADLEGWAIPADYEGLRRRLGVWDKHYQKVKKLKTR